MAPLLPGGAGGGPARPELLDAAAAELGQRRSAAGLLAAGLHAGDRVAVSVPSSAPMICMVLGALRVGIVPVLLSPDLTPTERALLVADAEAALDVADVAALEGLFDAGEAELAPLPRSRPMLYTSGTTGRPKGVWTGLWDDRGARDHFADEVDLWRPRPEDLHLVCAPTSHSAPLRGAMATLLAGGTLAVRARFDAAGTLDALRRLRPSTTFMVPTHMARLLALRELGEGERFDSLRVLLHAGAPCPDTLKRSMLERVGPGVLREFYGSTEGQFSTCDDDEWRAHPGTVGRARRGRRLRIVPSGDDGPGEQRVGTIWCTAPPFARFSYWHQPAATAAAWRGDEFTVGDLGWLDDEGYLYLVGRREDLIITGGVNVYPAEVEAAIAAFDGVAEVAVYGAPDERWGERVCAAVVASGELDTGALAADLARRLAPPKRPKQYTVVDALPRTPSGKVLRRHLGAGTPPPRGPQAQNG